MNNGWNGYPEMEAYTAVLQTYYESLISLKEHEASPG